MVSLTKLEVKLTGKRENGAKITGVWRLQKLAQPVVEGQSSHKDKSGFSNWSLTTQHQNQALFPK